MTTALRRLKSGLRHTGAIASCVNPAGVVTPVNLYLLSTGRTCHIRKIHIWNRNAGTSQIQIGTALAPLVPAFPAYFAVGAGMDLEITEDQIPEVEFTADVTCQASVAAAAPNDVQVQVEVEEYPGPNG